MNQTQEQTQTQGPFFAESGSSPPGWQVLGPAIPDSRGHERVKVRCACGTERIMWPKLLSVSLSCGECGGRVIPEELERPRPGSSTQESAGSSKPGLKTSAVYDYVGNPVLILRVNESRAIACYLDSLPEDGDTSSLQDSDILSLSPSSVLQESTAAVPKLAQEQIAAGWLASLPTLGSPRLWTPGGNKASRGKRSGSLILGGMYFDGTTGGRVVVLSLEPLCVAPATDVRVALDRRGGDMETLLSALKGYIREAAPQDLDGGRVGWLKIPGTKQKFPKLAEPEPWPSMVIPKLRAGDSGDGRKNPVTGAVTYSDEQLLALLPLVPLSRGKAVDVAALKTKNGDMGAHWNAQTIEELQAISPTPSGERKQKAGPSPGWLFASTCPTWEGCSIPVCPLDPRQGITFDGERGLHDSDAGPSDERLRHEPVCGTNGAGLSPKELRKLLENTPKAKTAKAKAQAEKAKAAASPPKVCPNPDCPREGGLFYRIPGTSDKNWHKKQHCSSECRLAASGGPK